MLRLLGLLLLIDLALLVTALIDCLSVEDPHEIRALPRAVWVVLIVFASPVGPVIWFMAGRPVRTPAIGRATVWRPGGLPEERPKTVAPDDDPEFLAGLGPGGGGPKGTNRNRREDDELLRRWEEDLRDTGSDDEDDKK